MKYTNGTFTGTYNHCRDYLNASIPREHPENWPNPDDPTGEIKWTVVEVKPYQPTLEQRIETQRHVLKIQRDERITSPINNIQVRDKDRDRIQRTINRWEEGNIGESIEWILEDNTTRLMTKSDLQSILDQYDLRELQIFAQYNQLLTMLNNSDDPESVTWDLVIGN